MRSTASAVSIWDRLGGVALAADPYRLVCLVPDAFPAVDTQLNVLRLRHQLLSKVSEDHDYATIREWSSPSSVKSGAIIAVCSL
ncbi:hypothetical protein BDZ89DRAFT_375568 [Hymenopellis radicata]|nr:hypothetical protein BDZ89DRAFT_375568 [Hymenopellis radicata]